MYSLVLSMQCYTHYGDSKQNLFSGKSLDKNAHIVKLSPKIVSLVNFVWFKFVARQNSEDR